MLYAKTLRNSGVPGPISGVRDVAGRALDKNRKFSPRKPKTIFGQAAAGDVGPARSTKIVLGFKLLSPSLNANMGKNR